MSKPATKKSSSKIKRVVKDIPDSLPAAPDFDDSLEKLFVSELKDMYWSENHLVLSLPKMIDAAADKKLKKAIAGHLEETRQHVSRLEEALEIMEEEIVSQKCLACEGLVLSGEQKIETTLPGTETRDASIIMASLKVENFEITSYEGLIRTAQKLGLKEVAGLLELNLQEEIAASEKLDSLA